MSQTLGMIKPDAMGKNNLGNIVALLEKNGFVVAEGVVKQLTLEDAEKFYAVHSERPFYGELVEFMTSGRVFAMKLEREDAVAKMREVIGATNPEEAAEGTIRKLYAENIGNNAIHASDSDENAAIEIEFFFGK